jgi:hypothetical protein
MYITCVGIVILLIILIVYRLYDTKRKQDAYLMGIWSGDKEFLKQSDLKDMHLFIAPIKDNGKLKAFLTISDKDGDTITNQVIWIDNSMLANKITITYSDNNFTAIPSSVTFNIDYDKGTLMVYADSKLYAFLIKNNEMSIVANDTYTNTE